MIKENIDGLTVRTVVTRICDDCGVEELKAINQILYSACRKKLGRDYCKKCAYKYRVLPDRHREKSVLWKGGKSLTKNGYYRINGGENKGEYEHKIIYGDFLGRKITREEKVHHIDGVKLNNDISNLFLCKDKSHHSLVHYQMEEVGLSLFLKYIWFDSIKKEYVLEENSNKKVIFQIDKQPSCETLWKNGKRYSYVYLGDRKHRTTHRYVFEQFLGRKLYKNEQVHHINGDTLDNDINNLILLSRSEHRKTHNSLQLCVLELYKNGVIGFKEGIYYVC